MNVVSLFDGLSGAMLALKGAGIKVTNYYASEVDKYAEKVSHANFPEIHRMGDVTKWREWDIDWSTIDLLTAGSPCQGFSMAGKQAGTAALIDGDKVIIDSRESYISAKAKDAEFASQSHLFWEFILCLDHAKECNPDIKFMLENVKMKKDFLNMITEAVGVEPVFINSALVSAQNRQRYYWANWEITQPEDRGLTLADILEYEVGPEHVVSDGQLKRLIESTDLEKGFSKINPEKAPCMTARQYANWKGTFVTVIGGSIVGRKINSSTGKRDDYSPNIKAIQRLELRSDFKTNCLTTVQKDNQVCFVFNDALRNCITKDGKAYSLLASYAAGIMATHYIETRQRTLVPYKLNPEENNRTYKGIEYRKLTPVECERLQGIKDNFTSAVSTTQRYKMLGNGWQIDTIIHNFECLVKEKFNLMYQKEAA